MNLISHYKLKNDQIVTSFMDVSTQIQDVGSYPVDQPVHWVDWQVSLSIIHPGARVM